MSVDFQIMNSRPFEGAALLNAHSFSQQVFRPQPIRRRLMRIGLAERVIGRLGNENALLIDISLSGVLLAHENSYPDGKMARLTFDWRGTTIDAEVEVVRSEMHRPLGISRTLQRSGVTFRRFFGSSEAHLRAMMTELVERALDERRSNARGIPPLAASLKQTGKVRGFQTHRFIHGSWQRTETVDPLQPLDGFTVSLHEDPNQVALLRETYEKLSESDRVLVRRMASMSLSNPDGTPARRYEP